MGHETQERKVQIPASSLLSMLAEAAPTPNTGADWGIWKWVVIIGGGAIALIYLVRRISDVVVKKKTATMIREVVGDEAARDADAGWDDTQDPGGTG
jgi:hypothetical protein